MKTVRKSVNGKINIGGKRLLLDYSRKQANSTRGNMKHVPGCFESKICHCAGVEPGLDLAR